MRSVLPGAGHDALCKALSMKTSALKLHPKQPNALCLLYPEVSVPGVAAVFAVPLCQQGDVNASMPSVTESILANVPSEGHVSLTA